MAKLVLECNHGKSIAEIYLHGATVSRYLHHHTEYIFMSDKSIFNGTKAIRGGVPLVFPQFSQPNPSMPQHGLLRTSNDWVHVSTDIQSDNDVCATLELTSTHDMLAVWPHHFVATLKVHLTNIELKFTLHMRNSCTARFDCHALLHTYLSVPSIHTIQIEGLHNEVYIDKLLPTSSSAESPQIVKETNEKLSFLSETDRIYIGNTHSTNVLTILVNNHPYIRTSKKAWKTLSDQSVRPVDCDVVVWNPWINKSTEMTDLGVDNYPKFVCIEPGTVHSLVPVNVGEQLSVEQTITPVTPLL
jgi:glucose-6-phosphate 1-epimerase